MAIMTRNRESGGDVGLTKHIIGNALVVYPVGNMTKAAQDLALTVAADTENDLVVVDLPISSPISMWESVAQVLPKRRRGVRLVIGGRSRETTALAGHWLAERLKRTVLVPDGPVVRGAGGSLFVHSGQGSGWVRCSPGKPPKFEAKRFPRPTWDGGVVSENFPTSARGIAEPLPSGVWIRPIGDDPQLRAHRMRLIEIMPCQPEYVTVVLGSPGGVPLSQDDVAMMWRELPEHVRDRVRFVQYGPMSVPRGLLGQVVADALGREVVFYAGMPIGPAVAPEIFTVRPDGSLGWHAYAREMSYRPRGSENEPPKVPSVVTHRAPIPGGQMISPGVYWYSVDAVVEVVQSGLLVRPPAATANVEAIRSVPTDPATHNLMFEADTEADLDRMEYLAGDLAQRLDNSVRTMSRVLSARSVLNEQAKPTFSHVASGFADTKSSAGIFEISAQASYAALPPSIAALPAPTEAPSSFREVSAPSAPAEIEAPRYESAQLSAPVDFGDHAPLTPPVGMPVADLVEFPPTPPMPPSAPVGPPMTESAPVVFDAPVRPPGLGSAPVAPPSLESSSVDLGPAEPPAPAEYTPVEFTPAASAPVAPPVTEPVPDVPEPAAETVEPTEPEAAAEPEPEPAAPAEQAAPKIARLQPVPPPEATGLLPKRGIEDERAWLRRTLATEFGTMTNSVARILSEHPGFQGALSRGSAEVLTDAVAVQLYLTVRGKAVDEALRTAANGPHVPFARCVVSGLSRLPSHRGPAVFTASPTPGQWDLYRDHKLVTEWGFLHAMTAPPAEPAGEVDVLVWSMTARRTRLLEAADGVQERVLFVPGTSFKVLEMTEPEAGGGRGQILLRELTAVEIDADGRVDQNRISLDELALNSLRRQLEQWADGSPSVQVNPASAERFGALPGLA
ncbi:hypothetical protein [Umezawaea sp. NPDC059074]|uniref:hypothetical protein n=1 Tax=Umezawaea sp. NPDC059074 TaxID=3346716 RepID=UPI00368F780B